MQYDEINFHKKNRRPVTDSTYQIDANEWNALGTEVSRQQARLNTLDPSGAKPDDAQYVTDAELEQYKANVEESLAAIGADIKNGAFDLITYLEFKAIKPKLLRYYFVAKDEAMQTKGKVWRIYLGAQLVGMFNTDGTLTKPTFPMRFPFRFA